MVIEGRQEIRVNFEIHEFIVAGIVRPEDIESDHIRWKARVPRTARAA